MIKMDENNILMMGSRQTWLLPLSAQSEAKWRRLPDLVRARNNFHLAQLGSRFVSTSCNLCNFFTWDQGGKHCRLLAVGSGAGVVEEWKEGKWAKVPFQSSILP